MRENNYRGKSLNEENTREMDRINRNLLKAIYAVDAEMIRIVELVKNPERAKITRLPSPWREKFCSLSLAEADLLYMDERLVILKELRQPIFRSLHWGHSGRDAMLAVSSDIWWPQIHREIKLLAKNFKDCQNAGKNIKCLQPQRKFGKIPKSQEVNEEIALDFAGPFQRTHKSKKYLLVSIDNKSVKDATFVSKPTTEKVIEFLYNYIANYGIPKRIRTDPGTVFTSQKFEEFCEKFFGKHIICAVKDHRGNGKVERLIRTINERLRANKKVVLDKDKAGLYEILFSLRINKSKEKDMPFMQNGKEPNTLKCINIQKPDVLENEEMTLEMEDFERDQDSTNLVREKSRVIKLEGTFKKKPGQVVGESSHTIEFLPKGGKQKIRYAKRDIGIQTKRAESQEQPEK